MKKADGEGRIRGTLRRAAATLAAFTVYVVRRFSHDGCFTASGALSYTTLVSLVPLAVIALGSLSVFPIFSGLRGELLDFVFRTFVPAVGAQAAYWFHTFADSAAQTTAIGIAGILATGVLVLVTVEDQLNVIWRVSAPRPWRQRILEYWAVITLGPLLIGASVSLSTYFEIGAKRAGFEPQAQALLQSGWLHGLARGVPGLIEFIALTLLYCLIPNCTVRWRDGAVGALVATIAIEILKIGFSAYLDATAFYRTVYGALAAIPIFLLWMYLSWMAVLLGAVVGAALPNWRIDARLGGIVEAGSTGLGISLALIAALARAHRRGLATTTPALAGELGVATTVIDEHIKPLAGSGFAAQTQDGRWVLSWNLESATLRDLYGALRVPRIGRWIMQPSTPWQRQVTPAMERIIAAESAAMSLRLAELVTEIGEADRSEERPPPPLPAIAGRIDSR